MLQLTLPHDLERVATEQAHRTGQSPQEVVLAILRQSLRVPDPDPIDEGDWRRQLESIARDCGTSLSDEALSSNGLYD